MRGIGKSTRPNRWLAALLTLLLGLAGTTANAEVVGSEKRLDPLLRKLTRALHVRGIDVVADDAVADPLGPRPRVTKLQDLHIVDDTVPQQAWMDDFVHGALGGLAAVKSGEKVASGDVDAFMDTWSAAPASKRVFISFTSADSAHAREVARALQRLGYVAFVFVEAPGAAPRYSPERVGKLFAEAGHHLALDTPRARKSPGVWLEGVLSKGRNGPRNGGGPGPGRPPDHPSPGPVSSGGGDSDPALKALLAELSDSIVTENPNSPGKLFVHRTQSGGSLIDLMYLVRKEADGSWTVFRPRPGLYGGTDYGTPVRHIKRPAVHVGRCGCR